MTGKFVYYTDLFDDYIQILEESEKEIININPMLGVILFSDDEISDYLETYRKTSFCCWSVEPEFVAETKRLAEKFGLAAQLPSAIDTLEQSFSELDSLFFSLFTCYLLVPVSESEDIIEKDKKEKELPYKYFFKALRRTSELLELFLDTQKESNDFADSWKSFSLHAKNRFLESEDSYNMLMKNTEVTSNKCFESTISYLNDAYFAYARFLEQINQIRAEGDF